MACLAEASTGKLVAMRHRLLFWGACLTLTGCLDDPTGGFTLPVVDSCPTPQPSTLTQVEVGPGGTTPFQPFVYGDLAKTVRGGQGLNMVNVRLRLVGPGLPACVKVRIGEVNRASKDEPLQEVSLKTYEQPDGSRVTKDYWQIV